MRAMRALFPLLFLAAPAFAAGDVTADMTVFAKIGAGVLCAAEASSQQEAPGTRLGFIDLVEGEITLGLPATHIPAIPGLAFGVHAMVGETGASGVTITVTHPPMGTDGTTVETWVSDFAPGDTTANFFRFDYPEERVPGTWTLQAELDGKVLYLARFQVVDPALMPNFVSPCELPPQLS
jgi:hypothetical protein